MTIADRLHVCYDEHIEKVALECGDIDPRSSVVISDTHNNVKQASKKSNNDTETLRSNDVSPFWDENSDIRDDEGYNTSASNQKEEEECKVDHKMLTITTIQFMFLPMLTRSLQNSPHSRRCPYC